MNYDKSNIQPIPDGIEQQDQFIASKAKEGYLFQTDAEDYFIFTKGTLPWRELQDVVIGRPGYDNYLVNYVYYHRQQISLIDTTNSSILIYLHFHNIVLIVHQTDKDGNKAGFRNNPDRNWNLQRIGNDWYMGRTEFTPYALEITPNGEYRMQYRDISGTRCDDAYLQQELDIMIKYIKPNDICLQTIHRATTGILLQYCKEVYVVVWDGRVYQYDINKEIMNRQMRNQYANEPRLHILFGFGMEK